MADWTPADEKRLNELERQYQDLQDEEEGKPHVSAHVEALTKPEPTVPKETRPFSFSTLGAGVIRDIAEFPMQLAEAAGDKLEQAIPLPIIRFGKDASNGYVDIVAGEKAKEYVRAKNQLPHIPQIEGTETAGTAERLTRSFLDYAVPFAGWMKALKAAQAATFTARAARTVAAAGLTDIINQDPQQSNLATTIKDVFGVDNETLDWLAYSKDDGEIVSRLKAAATNLPLNVATEGLFQLGGQLLKGYRYIRGTPEEAQGVVEALRHDYSIKKAPAEAAKVEDILNPEAGKAAAVPETAPFDKSIHIAIHEEQPKSWEDVVNFLKRMANKPDITEDALKEMDLILRDDPENALQRLGLDPVKLDWGEFANPEGVRNLHESLTNLVEDIGRKLGRSAQRVTEAELMTAARSMASDADILRVLFQRTYRLPEVLTAARLYVGGHARALLSTAETALDALLKDGGEQEWHDFVEHFVRHALFNGAARGAGSEIARSLRSLRMLARVNPRAALKEAESVAGKVKDPLSDDALRKVQDGVGSMLFTMKDPAERIEFLNKVLDKEGDIGDLNQFVRGTIGSAVKRVDGALKETLGSFFSQATAAYNVKSTISMVGLNALGRLLAAAVRSPFALVSAEQNRLARIAAADFWAYTEGAVASLSTAVHNTLTLLRKEGASELYHTVDVIGLKRLAQKATKAHAKAAKELRGKVLERVDIDASPRLLGLNPADRRMLDAWVESQDLPRLLEGSIKFLMRSAGTALNAAGTAYRAGTILFVNAMDELAGTVAVQAGAQSFAVRQAAMEAAELGLAGKDLSTYLKARVVSLTADIEGWHDQGFEQGFRAAAEAAGQHEARAALFQDPLESKGLRFLEKGIHNAPILGTLVIPFPHTPLRILEVTWIDRTPLGLAKKAMRDAILHGTPQQREQALAQIGLGVLFMWLGYRFAEDRDIVGSDGSFVSTARLNRESYSMRIGGDIYEFVRDDPLGSMLGFGADVRSWMKHHYQPGNPHSDSLLLAMLEAGSWAATMNSLSKMWLKSLEKLTELMSATHQGQWKSGLERYVQDMTARRMVPAAGIQKGIRQIWDPWEHEALTYQEKILKESFGATTLPVKRNWLGDPEEVPVGERFFGLTMHPEKGDPLYQWLDRLTIGTRMPEKDISGVDLNATQYSRLLELRGKVVKDPRFGLTMQEALRAAIKTPEWATLTDAARENQVRLIAKNYTKLAKKRLADPNNISGSEDKNLAARVALMEDWDTQQKAGLSDDANIERQQKFRQELEQLGYL